MKFIIAKKPFVNALQSAAKIANRNYPCVKLGASSGNLSLETNNLDCGIALTCDASVTEEGICYCNCNDLLKMATLMPEGDIEVKSTNKSLSLRNGACVFKSSYLDEEVFVPLPKIRAETQVTLPQCILKSMVRDIKCACDPTRSDYASFINVEMEDHMVCMTATDSKIVAVRTEELEYDLKIGKHINERIKCDALLNLSNMLSWSADESCTLSFDKQVFRVSCSGMSMIGRLVNDPFPDIKKLMGHKYKSSVSVSAPEFLQAVNRSEFALQSAESGARYTMIAHLGKQFRLESSGLLSNVEDELYVIEHSGGETVIGLNPQLLKRMLTVYPDETVTVQHDGPLNPIKIETEGFLFFVLPIRIGVG